MGGTHAADGAIWTRARADWTPCMS
jgi:hypothetical protein